MKRSCSFRSCGLILVLILLTIAIPDVLAHQHPRRNSHMNMLGPPEWYQDAEGVIWERTYGGANWEWANDLIEVSDGGYALVGFTDPTATTYGGVMWLVRTDADGNQLWNRTIGNLTEDVCRGDSLIECSDGGFAIAGDFLYEVPQHAEMWLVRTDANGDCIWNRTYNGPDGGALCTELIECSDGGFALYGGASEDYYFVRTDSNGVQLWNRTYGYVGRDFAWPGSLVQCDDGGFAMLGNTQSLGSDSQVLLVRTDSDGNRLWRKDYDKPGYDLGHAILALDSGFLIIAQNERLLLWVIRIDDDGTIIWDRSYIHHTMWYHSHGIGIGTSAVQCSKGGFAIAGYGGSTTMGMVGGDAWLLRIDDAGNLLWDLIYGPQERNEVHAIIECSDGGFALAGQTGNQTQREFDFWLLRVADSLPISGYRLAAMGLGSGFALIIGVLIFRRREDWLGM